MACEDGPEGSWSLVLGELLGHLRARADRRVAAAMSITVDLERGYKPAEIRVRRALTEREYRIAHRWAREELAGMREAGVGVVG